MNGFAQPSVRSSVLNVRASGREIGLTTADRIRALAADGQSVSQIARELGIRYQQAYQVLKRSTITPTSPQLPAVPTLPAKSSLAVAELTERGFDPHGCWKIGSDGRLTLELPLPKEVGVYAFAQGGIVQYVGVATMGLAKRIRFYARPGATQRTSQRLNALILGELGAGRAVEIYVALPPDLEWRGLPVHGSAGLELGLIKKFRLPWNMRSAG